MASIYKALMRAAEERRALHNLTGLSEIEGAAGGTAPQDASEDLIDLIASIESLPMLPRKKTIQFLGSHDGALAMTLARKFAEACAVSMDLPVLFVDPKAPAARRDGFFFLDPLSDRFTASRRFKSPDAMIRPAQPKNLSTCPFSAIIRLWSAPDAPGSEDSPWRRITRQFDMIVIPTFPVSDAVHACGIDALVDAVIVVFESEATDLQPSTGQGDLGLASILEQIAQGLWCPNHTFSCLDTPLLLLTRPSPTASRFSENG